jgi:hypothetical protein
MNNRQKGMAIVEFALILPLLLILTFITTEFGRALYEYNTLVKSARDAVRYLSMQDSSIKTTDPGRIAIAQNLVVYGVPAPASDARPLAPGLTAANVPATGISWKMEGANPAINTVTITITGYRFTPLVTGALGIVFGDADGGVTFNDITAVMRAQS